MDPRMSLNHWTRLVRSNTVLHQIEICGQSKPGVLLPALYVHFLERNGGIDFRALPQIVWKDEPDK